MSPKLSRQHQQIGEDYQTLCRLCLKKTSLKLDIYHEEGIQRDIPGKILNCLSLIVTEDDNLPKFVCVSCIDKLDNFQDFRDMCHESENLLTNYVSAVEECNRTKQQYKAASTSSPHMRAGSKRKLNFSEPYPSPQREPVPDFVACKIKTEPQDTHLNVPPQQETFRDAWQPKPSTVVKSEPVEEQMTVDPSDIFGGSSSQQYPQTVAGTSSFGQQESAYLGASDDSAQFGASAFEDSDDDVVQLSPEEVEKTELKTERESPAGAGERYLFQNTRRGSVVLEGHSATREVNMISSQGLRNFTISKTTSKLCNSEESILVTPGKEDTASNLKPPIGQGESDSSHTPQGGFHCNVCNKVIPHRSHFVNHMRIHTGEKPYSCPTYNKAFNWKSDLKRHSRIHSGLKPYTCPVCDKQFNQSSILKKHVAMHAAKPYLCRLCCRGFATEDDLNKHSLLPHV